MTHVTAVVTNQQALFPKTLTRQIFLWLFLAYVLAIWSFIICERLSMYSKVHKALSLYQNRDLVRRRVLHKRLNKIGGENNETNNINIERADSDPNCFLAERTLIFSQLPFSLGCYCGCVQLPCCNCDIPCHDCDRQKQKKSRL